MNAFIPISLFLGAPATAEIIDLPAVTKSKKVTIKWNEPQNNGASIILYTVYQRVVKKGDIKGEWIKIREIKDLSRRQVVVSLEKNKVYEFVVTAKNSFGESLREGQNIRKLNVSGGRQNCYTDFSLRSGASCNFCHDTLYFNAL